MARRRSTSTFEDMVELASRLPWWVALILSLASYLLLHAYATSPLPAVTDSRQIGQHLTSSMLRGIAMGGQYFLPLVFVLGAIGSIFARSHRQKLLENTAAAIKPGRSIEGISWHEFELLVGEVFRRRGYSVLEQGGAGPDGGVDLVLHKDREKYLVQCKHWRSVKVGVPVAREFFGAMVAEGAVGGFIVTSGLFTSEAKEFAGGRNIHLIEGDQLSRWILAVRGSIDVEQAVVSCSDEFKPLCPKCKSAMIHRTARRGLTPGVKFWGCSKFPRCKGVVN